MGKRIALLIIAAAGLGTMVAACGVLSDLGTGSGEVRCRRSEPDGGCTTHLLCGTSSCADGETEVDGGAPGCFNQIGQCLQ